MSECQRLLLIITSLLACAGLAPGIRAQASIGDFECHAAGNSIAAAPNDCEGWTDQSFFPLNPGLGVVREASEGCAGMPSKGSHFLSIVAFPSFSVATTPSFQTGTSTAVWPFTNGAVTVLSKTTIASEGAVSCDWSLLRSANASRHFLEVLVVDPTTNQIITPVVVADTASVPFTPGLCPSTLSGGSATQPFLEGTGLQSSLAMLPSNWIGQPVRIVLAFGPAVGGPGTNPLVEESAALIDNLAFVPRPPQAARELLVTPAPLNFGASIASGPFSLSATVSGYVDPQGTTVTDPTLDPIIGADLSLTGTIVSSGPGLRNAVFTATILDLVVVPNSDELRLIGQFAEAPNQTRSRLGGTPAVYPVVERAVASTVFASPIRTGAGSSVLDGIRNAIGTASQELTFSFDVFSGQTPQLTRLILDHQPRPRVPEYNLVTDGAGSIALGVVGASPLDELFNVFVTNPTVAQGQGLFFGLEFTPLVADILSAPLGAAPFHVALNADGSYFWGLPSGSLPPGLVLDGASGTVNPQNGFATWVSPVIRRTF